MDVNGNHLQILIRGSGTVEHHNFPRYSYHKAVSNTSEQQKAILGLTCGAVPLIIGYIAIVFSGDVLRCLAQMLYIYIYVYVYRYTYNGHGQ